jgi:hypothetical protein
MAIQIPQPSMALNAKDIEKTSVGNWGKPFLMWRDWTVETNITRDQIIKRVADAADSAPDGYLRVLLINAHGWHAYLSLGQGLRPLAQSYERWKGRVANIWFCSCGLVGMATHPKPEKPADWNDGNLFCSGLAKLTGAYVMASPDEQPLQIAQRWGTIPDWQGNVLRYEPEHGSVDWHHRYPTNPIAEIFTETHPRPPISLPPRFRALQGGPGVFSRPLRPPPGPTPRPPPPPRPGMLW